MTRASDGWIRHGPHYIPYARGTDPITTLSAARFLSDPDLARELKGRYVLIGSTATGLGDFVSTPVSYDHERMPGVELNAHILSGLLAGRIAADIAPGWQTVLTVALSGAGAALIVMASFPLAAMLLAIAVVLVFGLSVALLFGWQQWFAPATALIPVILSFPIWGVWSLIREKRINRVLSANVQYQAMHHQATGLPNQYVLEERLRQLGDRGSDGRMATLLIVHVSRTDSIGGMAGDAGNNDAQRAISARLVTAVQGDDLVAHLSGGDFAVFRDPVETPESATQFATHIMDRLRAPLEVNTATLYLVPRMGMSLWPADTESGPGLLSTAYTAMFRARIERARSPRRYSEDVAREVEAHAQLERSLVSALENGEFEVYYQPLVRSDDGRCIGVEALLRWHNPELGLVYPATFIPVAEHNGLIREIGGWVLRTACRQVKAWTDQGFGPIRLAVNLSPLQFNDGNLIEEVKTALEQSGLAPDSLELEITESALMQNTEEAIRLMLALKDIGVHLAIDDFGTGYSSLSHLRHFPFDRIKIDRTFTQDVPGQADVNEIALTIIDMARRMNRSIVVEGIEQPEQAQFFQSNGCEEMQGYLFGHPVPADELVDLLRRNIPT